MPFFHELLSITAYARGHQVEKGHCRKKAVFSHI